MRYFKSQQIIALDHREEEREFNHVPYDKCGVNVDSKVRYWGKMWLHEDDMQGVAESLVATPTDGVAAVATAVRGLSSHQQMVDSGQSVGCSACHSSATTSTSNNADQW